MMNNADMPAMPAEVWDRVTSRESHLVTTTGLTKREHFAGLAFQALISRPNLPEWLSTIDKQAVVAVEAADALLKQLQDEG